MEMVMPHAHRAALALQAGIQEATPVRSGHLRRGWNTGQPSRQGRVVRVKVGNAVVYARYQNTRTVNKGYVERGVEAARAKAERVLRDGITRDAQGLWKVGG
jgi:hypothetical protein